MIFVGLDDDASDHLLQSFSMNEIEHIFAARRRRRHRCEGVGHS